MKKTEIATTLNKIKSFKPCEEGWVKLLKHLGKTDADDEPLLYKTILESNDIKDTIWAFRCEFSFHLIWIKFSLACCRKVQHLMKDERSIKTLDSIQDFLDGKIKKQELNAAYAAAYAAADAAVYAAYAAANAAAYAAADAARKEQKDILMKILEEN